MPAVVVTNVAEADRLAEQAVREVVMESTAQYRMPVWQAMEEE